MTTQFFEPEFRVLHIASDDTQGYIRAISDLNTVESLDEAGTLSFTVAATDEEAARIDEGSQFDVYDREEGYLGRYIFQSSETADSQGEALLRVDCWSSIIQLQRRTVGFNRAYSYHTVEEIANDLTLIHEDWFCSAESGLGYATASYEGETILGALTALRDKFKLHFRLAPGERNRLEFGNLGDNRGVRLMGMGGMPQFQFGMTYKTALIDSITRKRDGDAIINRVIALGAGQGSAQLTMKEATYSGEYELMTGINQDGSLYYYVEDTVSQNKYDLREIIVIYSDIGPVSDDGEDEVSLANQLKIAAEAELLTYKDPTEEYAISVRHLPVQTYIGDVVQLVYQGAVDGVGYMDIDNTYTVVEISRNRSSSGQRTARLTISSTGEKIEDDNTRLVDALRQAAVERLHVQPIPTT